MAYKDIRPGKYKARAVKGAIIESAQKQTPGVTVCFEFELPAVGPTQPASLEQLWWTGWLTENTLERTVDSLAIAGYEEVKGHLPDGTIPESHFTPGTFVEIDVQNEPYEKEENGVMVKKDSMKIKWVNKLGGSQFGTMKPEAMKSLMSSIDMKKQMAAARLRLGMNAPAGNGPSIKNSAPQTSAEAAARNMPAAPAQPNFGAEEVPF